MSTTTRPASTRRNLLGHATGAMAALGLVAHAATTSADPSLTLANRFTEANARYTASNYDPALTEDEVYALSDARYALLNSLAETPALTNEGLVAKAAALRAAMFTDVPNFAADTFADCARPYHLLADSLVEDVLRVRVWA